MDNPDPDKGSPPAMRELNRRLVLRALRDRGEATRPQLAAATGLSAVTVSAVLAQLVAEDAAREGEVAASQGGRPSRLYRFHAGQGHVLAVFTRETDGMDTAYLRVADLDGRVVEAAEVALGTVDLAAFERPIDALVGRYPTLRALAFGLPGSVSEGVLVATDYAALVGVPLVDHFARRHGLPVLFENDVNAAVVGYGGRFAAAGSVVYLYFPRKYPPGAGILLDSRLHRGHKGLAGEVGYLPLGVPWGEPARFSDPAWAAGVVALLVSTVAGLLNPDEIVLHGEFLTEECLALVDQACRERLPPGLRPRLTKAPDFTADLEHGLVSLALKLLDHKERR